MLRFPVLIGFICFSSGASRLFLELLPRREKDYFSLVRVKIPDSRPLGPDWPGMYHVPVSNQSQCSGGLKYLIGLDEVTSPHSQSPEVEANFLNIIGWEQQRNSFCCKWRIDWHCIAKITNVHPVLWVPQCIAICLAYSRHLINTDWVLEKEREWMQPGPTSFSPLHFHPLQK